MEGTWCGWGKNAVWCVLFVPGERPEGRTETSLILGGRLVNPLFLGCRPTCKACRHSPNQQGRVAESRCLCYCRLHCRKMLWKPGNQTCQPGASPPPLSLSWSEGEPSVWTAWVVLQICPQPNAPNNSLQQGQHGFSAYSLFLIWQLFKNFICCTCQDW